jgi:hypothetical protein
MIECPCRTFLNCVLLRIVREVHLASCHTSKMTLVLLIKRKRMFPSLDQDEKAHVLLGTTLAPGRGADPRFGHSWDVATSAQRKGMVGASDLTSYDEASNFSGDNSQNLYHSSSNRTNLSPGQLDRRDAPALIALASHGYGAEGEYRSKPGNNRVLGLEERSELATARDMQRCVHFNILLN